MRIPPVSNPCSKKMLFLIITGCGSTGLVLYKKNGMNKKKTGPTFQFAKKKASRDYIAAHVQSGG